MKTKAAGAEKPKQHLASEAYRQIRRDIVRCKLRPGSDVSEGLLAARYGVGKAPIRTALHRLVQEQLIIPVPHRGHRVAPITLKWVKDTFAIRILLEVEAARRAAGKVDVERLRQIDTLLEAGYEVGDEVSTEKYLRLNTEFHVLVAVSSGNDRLVGTLRQLLDDMERILHFALKLKDETVEVRHEHRAMVDALVAGDGEIAASITREQVLAAEETVVGALVSTPQMMSMSLEVPA